MEIQQKDVTLQPPNYLRKKSDKELQILKWLFGTTLITLSVFFIFTKINNFSNKSGEPDKKAQELLIWQKDANLTLKITTEEITEIITQNKNIKLELADQKAKTAELEQHLTNLQKELQTYQGYATLAEEEVTELKFSIDNQTESTQKALKETQESTKWIKELTDKTIEQLLTITERLTSLEKEVGLATGQAE